MHLHHSRDVMMMVCIISLVIKKYGIISSFSSNINIYRYSSSIVFIVIHIKSKNIKINGSVLNTIKVKKATTNIMTVLAPVQVGRIVLVAPHENLTMINTNCKDPAIIILLSLARRVPPAKGATQSLLQNLYYFNRLYPRCISHQENLHYGQNHSLKASQTQFNHWF